MYHRDKVSYQPVPLPDRIDLSDAAALAAAEAFRDYMKKRHTVRDFSPRPGARSGDPDLCGGSGFGAIGCKSPAVVFRGNQRYGDEGHDPGGGGR